VILYCLLEWPYNRNIDGLDPVWVSQVALDGGWGIQCAFPSVLNASTVAVLVRNHQAEIFKAPNTYPSWLNRKITGFDKYIAKSVNIQEGVMDFVKGADPENRIERVAVCYENISDYTYSPSEEMKNFITDISSQGIQSKGLEGNIKSAPEQIEECRECNGKH
jgi:hypothetical protein